MVNTLSINDIRRAVTSYPWTKNFRHMLPASSMLLRQMRGASEAKIVHTKERIKWWNIVPGDQIKIAGDVSNQIHVVAAVNKLKNLVYIRREAESQSNKSDDRFFHYSRCQLFLGNYEFPAQTPGGDPVVLPVFAKRMGTSEPLWKRPLHRFDWERFAVKTTPNIPHLKGQRIVIPWPKYEPPTVTPSDSEAPKDVVAQVTYKPPYFNPAYSSVPKVPNERDFLAHVLNPQKKYPFAKYTTYAEYVPPAEVYLSKELSNPHSRAKKQRRWQAYLAYKKSLKNDFIVAEVKELNGRSVKEATADALWKYREQLATEKKALAQRRREKRGELLKLEIKRLRKMRKARRQRDRLTNVVLKEEENQFVPS